MGNAAVTLRPFLDFHRMISASLLQFYASLLCLPKSTTNPLPLPREEPVLEEVPVIRNGDVEVVMGRLGLAWEGGDERWCEDYVRQMVAEEEASEAELAQAFEVIDANGDGYVDADELRGVMRRLRMGEGLGVEDCRRMIDVFDKDGDGRIDFVEFRDLLEGVD